MKMPKTIISEGKTTNEAIENGLKELNVTKNDVEINGIKILIENEENKSFKDEQIKFDEIFYKI